MKQVTLAEIAEELALLEQIDRGAYTSWDLRPLEDLAYRRLLLVAFTDHGRTLAVRLSKKGKQLLADRRFWTTHGSHVGPNGEKIDTT